MQSEKKHAFWITLKQTYNNILQIGHNPTYEPVDQQLPNEEVFLGS